MKSIIFANTEFAPGKVWWNHLSLDESLPLSSQLDDLVDDMLFVQFENGCKISVGWLPESSRNGRFLIDLNQNPDCWEPKITRECGTFDDLKRTLREFTGIARREKSRYLLNKDMVRAQEVFLNRLALEPDAPLAEQLHVLAGDLFEASYEIDGRVLTVGWAPPHDASGEFVIRFYRSQTEWRTEATPQGTACLRERDPKSWQLISEKRCKSVPELMAIVTEMANEAISPRPGDRT